MNRRLRLIAWALLAVAVLWHGLLPIAGYDIWWQMALGRTITQAGWPTTDPWSHTFGGAPWPYKDGVSALVYWAAWSAGGAAALVLVKSAVFAATVLAWAGLIRRRVSRARTLSDAPGDAGALVVLLTALVITTTAFRFTIRPQVFSFAALVACAWVLERARDGGAWWPLVPIVWLNALMHRGALLLPPLLLVWVVARWLDARRNPPASGTPPPRAAFACVAASALVVLAVPDGTNIVTTSLAMVSDPVLHGAIPEWWRATPHNVWAASPGIVAVLGLVIVASVLELRRGRAARFEVVALLVFGVVAASPGIRYLPYLPLISLLGVASVLGDRPEWSGRLSGAIALAAAAVTLASTLVRPLPVPRLGVERARLPAGSVAFLKANRPRGDGFNDFAFGGYLIFELDGEVPVYIDGRNDILYPASFIREYVDAVRDPAALLALLERRGIDWVVLPTTPDDPARSAWERAAPFTAVHVDGVAVTYVRRGSNADLESRFGYRYLAPIDVSNSLLRAAATAEARAGATAEVERLLAGAPDHVYAHIVAARWYALLGPEGIVELARHQRWLREH